MKINLNFAILVTTISLIRTHTHDEISKCALTGVHKTRQTILESPNYPDNYPADTCWDYVIRSPYRCPTKFHIQFLDFYLEASKDCKNDYLAVGLDNVDDDMDVLCGQIVGIKKYHTPDGILRFRFLADDSPWSTGKGFKLLVTRLACEKEELLREITGDDSEDGDDTIAVDAPSKHLKPPNSEIMEIFRNLSIQDQHQVYPLPSLFGLNYPTQLPSPPYPGLGSIYLPSSESRGPIPNYPGYNIKNTLEKPCNDKQQQPSYAPSYAGALNGNLQQPYLPSHIGSTSVNQQPQSYLPNYVVSNQLQPTSYIGTNNAYLPTSRDQYIGSNQLQPTSYIGTNNAYLHTSKDQYIGSWPSSSRLRAYEGSLTSLEACCTSGFQQKRFYLSSPGFPRTIFSNILPNNQQRDCEFQLQKSSPNVCRLRLEFKFFDFGQSYQGTGSYQGNIGYPAIESTQNTCTDDYIEIDNQRFCGCRSGNVFNAFWNEQGNKKLRMRMGYSGIPSGGFLLEIIQEECSETQFSTSTTGRPFPSPTVNPNQNLNNRNIIAQQHNQDFLNQQRLQLQQQQQQQQQNNYAGSFQGYYPGQQTFIQNPIQQPANYPPQDLFNNPGFSSNFPQQPQQQLSIQSSQIYQPHPPQFASNYLPSSPQDFNNNLLQQSLSNNNAFGITQLRYARSYTDQTQTTPTPVTIVETNSTRKEYYFTDNDALTFNDDPKLSIVMSRSSNIDAPSRWDEENSRANKNNLESVGNTAKGRRKCSFDMGDILRLSVDILWLTKPTCYAPQRNWFTNFLG